MNEILKKILKYFDFLYYNYGFEFNKSYIDSTSNYSYISLGIENINVIFMIENGISFILIKCNFDIEREFGFDLSIVQELIDPDKKNHCNKIDKSNSRWLKNNLEKIIYLFSKEEFITTSNRIIELQKERANLRWGRIE